MQRNCLRLGAGLLLGTWLGSAPCHAQAVEPRYGARWIKWVTDLPVVVALWRQGELSWQEYLASVRCQLVTCEWERQDPWPFFLQAFLLPYLMTKRGF